jgi:beta-glucosidase
LKGFAKVELKPGETRTVSIPLDFRDFAYYHPAYKQWITEDGEYEILIGASSADIRCAQTVTLQSTLQLPCLLDRESTLQDWLDDPRGKAVFQSMFQQMIDQMAKSFGVGEGQSDMIGMDMLGFMRDMPLLSLFQFQAAALPTTPENIVDGLLAQVHAFKV